MTRYNTDLIKLFIVSEFNWLSQAQLRDVFSRLDRPACRQAFTLQGLLVIKIMLAWLDDDLQNLNLLSSNYLLNTGPLIAKFDLQMIKLFTYSAIQLKQKRHYDDLYRQLIPALRDDLEMKILNRRYLEIFYPDPVDRMFRELTL
jgi:hypothetical protein